MGSAQSEAKHLAERLAKRDDDRVSGADCTKYHRPGAATTGAQACSTRSQSRPGDVAARCAGSEGKQRHNVTRPRSPRAHRRGRAWRSARRRGGSREATERSTSLRRLYIWRSYSQRETRVNSGGTKGMKPKSSEADNVSLPSKAWSRHHRCVHMRHDPLPELVTRGHPTGGPA